jgi:hypothetical protein
MVGGPVRHGAGAGMLYDALGSSAGCASTFAARPGCHRRLARPPRKAVHPARLVVAMRTIALLISAGLTAQAPHDAPPRPRTTDLVFRGVCIDDGNRPDLHARGEGWKAHFGPRGAVFQPRPATRAERPWPVTFALDSIAVGGRVRRAGAAVVERTNARRVTLRREVCREVWDLAPDHVEQSFVFDHAPGRGAMSIAIACETELDGALDGAGALRFTDPDGGGVVCSDAVAHDAAGRRLPLPIGWRDGRVWLEVPAEWLASATWPVVVDPIVRVLGLPATTASYARPKAAYDAANDVWLVVVEDEVSPTDTDVLVFRLALDGTVLDSTAAELGPNRAFRPDVAGNGQSGRSLIAWFDGTAGTLVHRYRLGNDTTYGPLGLIPVNGVGAASQLALGGCRTTGLTLMAWTQSFLQFDQCRATTVDVLNTIGPIASIGAATSGALALDISDRSGAAGDWGLVRQATIGTSFHGVRAGAVNGPLVVAAALTLPNVGSPRVAGDGPFVAVGLDFASPPTVRGFVLTGDVTTGFSIALPANLTALEGSLAPVTDRSDLTFCGDGCRFAYSIREDHPTTPTATMLNTIRPQTGTFATFVFDERRVGVSRVGPEPSSCMASATGGPAGACLLLEVDGSPAANLAAVRYDARTPGDPFALVPTACGVPFAPLLGAVGQSVLGGDYVVRFQRTVGAPLLLAGFPETTPPLVCAANPNCRRGVQLPAPTTVFGNQLAVTVPRQPALIGVALAFQGIDLLGPGGCPASAFGLEFRLSDTLLATVR